MILIRIVTIKKILLQDCLYKTLTTTSAMAIKKHKMLKNVKRFPTTMLLIVLLFVVSACRHIHKPFCNPPNFGSILPAADGNGRGNG